MSGSFVVAKRGALLAALLLGAWQLTAVSSAEAAPKKAGKTAAKPAAKAHATPSAMDREVSRHVRQMGKLNRERVEAEKGGDRKAVTRVAKQVALELKRHEARRAAITKQGARAARAHKPAT
jgi:hypothetical protein